MQDHAPDTAIITVTYNSENFVDDFLASVAVPLTASEQKAVLVVVDNASTDRTVERVQTFVERHQLEARIRLLARTDNVGFGRGCNAGVEAVQDLKVSYYWFLNPDTRVFPDTGSELKRFLEERPDVHFVGSQLVNQDNEARPSAFRFPSLTSEFCRAMRLGLLDRLLPQGQIALPVSDRPHQADWLTGASFMVRSDVYQKLEGFDPNFFLYFEEVDLFYRARRQGFNCWFNPRSRVYHFAGASTGISSGAKPTKPRPQYWFDSRRYFYCKNFGRAYFALCDLATILGLSLWELRRTIQQKDNSDPPRLLRDIAANSVFSWKAGR